VRGLGRAPGAGFPTGLRMLGFSSDSCRVSCACVRLVNTRLGSLAAPAPVNTTCARGRGWVR